MTELPTGLEPLVLQGNVLDVLASLPRASVHCSVFSPPFWGLRHYDLCGCAQEYTRDYDEEHPFPKHERESGAVNEKKPDPGCRWCGGTGTIHGMETMWGGDQSCEHEYTVTPPRRQRKATDVVNPESMSAGNRGSAYDATGGKSCTKCGAWFGSLGLEPSPFLYVDHLVDVMRALWPVLRDDGTVWMEIGDTYLTHPAGVTGARRWKASTLSNRDHSGGEQAGIMDKRQPGMREGNLALVPHRVAIALQDEGWIVRQDNVWNRRNPMPESVRNRPTRSHSYVFLLAKEPGYFYDGLPVREELSDSTHARIAQRSFWSQTGGQKDYSKGTNPNRSARQAVKNMARKIAAEGSPIKGKASFYNSTSVLLPPGSGRNLRSVWTLASEAFREAHYATFPRRIPETCVLAGTSERGACPDCGAPWERVVGLGEPIRAWQRASGGDAGGEYGGTSKGGYREAGAEDPSDVKRRILTGMRRQITVGWTPTCGCCPDPCDRCGAAWTHATVLRRVSTFNVRVRDARRGVLAQKSGLGGEAADATDEEMAAYAGSDRLADGETKLVEVDVSWPGCECRKPVPCIVLDPFGGSGTTALVAKRLGRRSVLIELSPYYVDMATRRVQEVYTDSVHHPAQRRLTEFAET